VDVSAPAPPLSFVRVKRDPFSKRLPLCGSASGVLLRRHSGKIVVIICVFFVNVKRDSAPFFRILQGLSVEWNYNCLK